VREVRRVTTDEASDDLLREIRRLAEAAFAGNFSEADWEHARDGWHVFAVVDGLVVAHAAVVARDLEVGGQPRRAGYVEAVATAPNRQREGLGSIVMAEVGALLRSRYEFGALATGRHAFYERLGWERWQGPTFVRRGEEAVRTAHDDGAVMVLRFGSSEELDLTAPISCEARTGDHW
jgi:aminoglycoside 2'-N-acetyltransferase I